VGDGISDVIQYDQRGFFGCRSHSAADLLQVHERRTN
jgi:hypothetical protein